MLSCRRFVGISGAPLAFVIALMATHSASAIPVQTVQPASAGNAERVWGQSLTINVGATVADSLITPTVDLDFVGFRTGDPKIGSASRSSVYLHVYTVFGITAGGAIDPTAIGSLVAVSTNALALALAPAPALAPALEVAAPGTDASWFFNGEVLQKDIPYYYVMANSSVAATPSVYSQLVFSDMEVGSPNPHAGGQALHEAGNFGGGPLSEDLYFRVVAQTLVPEPGTALLLGIGLAGPGARRR